ncbi:four helix bundle protein [Patescibacteria group bacterium]|nr:four helix bundle protein [Patescibacteria group bacterium]
MPEKDNYFENLRLKMDEYAHFVYKIARSFPKTEIYGITSQIQRATISVVLNYIEGYARNKILVKQNFWEISYGSLKESKYLLNFCYKEKFISEEDYKKSLAMAEEIGAMLWRAIESLKRTNNS